MDDEGMKGASPGTRKENAVKHRFMKKLFVIGLGLLALAPASLQGSDHEFCLVRRW